MKTPPRPGLGWRVVLALAGVVLLIVGLIGLALPGLQGILTLVAALACLSFASDSAHRLLRWCFRPWPRGWRRFLEGRRWLERKLGLRDSQ